MTAGAYSLSLTVPKDGFSCSGVEPVRGGTKEQDLHRFCPECLSWVFTRFPDGMPFVNMRASMLDDPQRIRPFAEFQTAEKLPGVDCGAVVSYERFPPEDEYMALASRFAAEWTG